MPKSCRTEAPTSMGKTALAEGAITRTALKLPIMRHATCALSLCNGLPWIGINCGSIPPELAVRRSGLGNFTRRQDNRRDSLVRPGQKPKPRLKDRALQTACSQLNSKSNQVKARLWPRDPGNGQIAPAK